MARSEDRKEEFLVVCRKTLQVSALMVSAEHRVRGLASLMAQILHQCLV